MKKTLTKNNKIRRIYKKKLTKKGGNGSLQFNNITNKNIILDKLTTSSKISNSDNKIQSIRNTYSEKENIKDHLYDFIFDSNTKQLVKIWDHKIGKPETITAGLPGIHIYVTLDPNGRFVKKIIGTFVRG